MELTFWQARLEISTQVLAVPTYPPPGQRVGEDLPEKATCHTTTSSDSYISMSPKQSNTNWNITKARSLRLLKPSKSGVAWSLFSDRAQLSIPPPHALSREPCCLPHSVCPQDLPREDSSYKNKQNGYGRWEVGDSFCQTSTKIPNRCPSDAAMALRMDQAQVEFPWMAICRAGGILHPWQGPSWAITSSAHMGSGVL